MVYFDRNSLSLKQIEWNEIWIFLWYSGLLHTNRSNFPFCIEQFHPEHANGAYKLLKIVITRRENVIQQQ